MSAATLCRSAPARSSQPAGHYRDELADHQAVAAAVLPLVAGAVRAFLVAREAFDQTLPAEFDVDTINERCARWHAETGSEELQSTLEDLADVLALALIPQIESGS